MACAMGTIRYSFFLLNFIWMILGICVILFGALGWDAMPLRLAIIILVHGTAMIGTSIIGCIGAMRQARHLMWAYIILMITFLVSCIILIITSTPEVFKKFAINKMEMAWIEEVYKEGSMNSIQVSYECCGYDAAEDYKITLGRSRPASCCKDNNCINPLNHYNDGCLKQIEKAFSDETATTRICRWGLLSFNAIITVLALLYAIHLTNRERRYNYRA